MLSKMVKKASGIMKEQVNHFTYEIAIPEIREKVEKVIRKIFDDE
jgi:hypothetical protein